MKKVLAWAVALALVLSSFTMAFAADAPNSSQFKDADQIQYTEAVDVMVATGVINGFPDGTFGPQKTVTRGQMAKMIAVIMNGGEDVGDQYKSACPFADSQNHWAAGYIAYCASEHIIDGRSADTFDPDADVTGTEVAKMALTSLGYDSKIQGYTGENWAVNVLKDAKKNNLFEGLNDFTPADPCSREAAAQILFNMLKATMVEYENGTSISVGDDVSVVVASKIQDQTWPDASSRPGYQAPAEDDNGDGLKQLYEEVFGGKLEQADTSEDEFGRPAHEWTYEDESVGVYTDDADYEFNVTDATDMDAAITAFDKDLGKEVKAYATSDKEVVVNGTTGTIALGDKVELYVDKKAKTYKAVVTQYKPVLITKVDTKKISKEEAEDGITAKLTLKGDIPAAVKAANNKMVGYDESTYVEDAVIAVAVGKKDNEDVILDSYVAEELVAGAVTKIKGDTVTIDGTAYEKTGVYAALDGVNFEVKKEFTVYDYNGYAFASIKSKDAPVEVFYGVLTDKKSDTSETGWSTDVSETTELVRIFTAEGQMQEFTLAEGTKIPDGIVTPADSGKISVEPTLIAYEKNEDGEITKITKATTDPAMGPAAEPFEPVKTGDVLYGKQLSKDVVAFANIGTEKPEWKVYSLADLEGATGVQVKAYFDETAGITAMMVGSLEDAAEPNVVMAFFASGTEVQNDTGNAYDIVVFEKGKETPYTTVGDNDKTKAAYDKVSAYITAFNTKKVPAELVKLTFDGELVSNIEVAKCVGANAPVKEFPAIDGSTPAAKYDAVFFTTKTDPQYLVATNIYKVLGTSDTYLNVGTADKINNQTVTADAAVFYINEKVAMEESEFTNIEADNYVILMQLNASSSTWDTVIYTDKLPAGYSAVNETPAPTLEP